MSRILRSITCGLCGGVILLVALWGCSPIPEFGEATTEETYDVGRSALEREDYLVAIEAFKRVTANAPLDELADDAVIGLADAYSATGDYATAEAEYRRLTLDYPRSPLVAEAEYKIGLTYAERSRPAVYDQTATREAVAHFERFLAKHPNSEFVTDARREIAGLRAKLAEKLYTSAMLYIQLKSHASARIYLESVITDYADTMWAPRALLALARSHARDDSTALADDAYRRLIEKYPDSEEATAASEEISP